MSRKSSVNKIKRDNSSSKNIEAGLVMDLYQKGHSPITTHFKNVGFAECDVLSITKSNYICEYEVKISRSDFKADFKKPKHKLITEKKFVNETVKWPYYGGNYFYFVVPENLITVDELPDYAGLIYVRNAQFGYNDYPSGELKVKDIMVYEIIKKAPLLHKAKASNDFIRSLAHQLTCKLVFRKVD